MTQLTEYMKWRDALNKAQTWARHLEVRGTGYQGDSAKVHSIGANPVIAIQYSCGGKNYWAAKEETSKEFTDALDDAIKAELPHLVEMAINRITSQVEIRAEAARIEYRKLFGSEFEAAE